MDAHFAIAMRHVHRYVKETKGDVANTQKIARALHWDGGIANCTTELVSICRDGPNLEKWRQGAAGRHFITLRRVVNFLTVNLNAVCTLRRCSSIVEVPFRSILRGWLLIASRGHCADRLVGTVAALPVETDRMPVSIVPISRPGCRHC